MTWTEIAQWLLIIFLLVWVAAQAKTTSKLLLESLINKRNLEGKLKLLWDHTWPAEIKVDALHSHVLIDGDRNRMVKGYQLTLHQRGQVLKESQVVHTEAEALWLKDHPGVIKWLPIEREQYGEDQ